MSFEMSGASKCRQEPGSPWLNEGKLNHLQAKWLKYTEMQPKHFTIMAELDYSTLN